MERGRNHGPSTACLPPACLSLQQKWVEVELCPKTMQNTLNFPLELSEDGIPSQAFSDSLAWPNFHEVNAEDSVMVGLPMMPSSQGGTMKPLQSDHGGNHLNSNGWLINGDPVLGRVANMDVLQGSQETLCHRQVHMHDESNNFAISPTQQDIPPEYFRAFPSSSCASSSAALTSLNCGYHGLLLGDVNEKWNFNKFLLQPEFSWKTAGFQPIQFCETLNPSASGWTSPNDQANMPSTHHPCGSSNPNNELLSLSLASSRPSSVICGTTNYGVQCSDTSSGSGRELSLSFGSSSKSAADQFSQMILGSRYLHAVQEILSENASYWLEGVDPTSCNSSVSLGLGAIANQQTLSGSNDVCSHSDEALEASAEPPLRRQEVELKRSQLLSLLQMVDDQYTQCLDEIHTVVSAFHAASELDPRIHGRFALQTISFLYKTLRDKISSEILRMGTHIGDGSASEKETSFGKSFVQKQWTFQQLRRKDQQLWRPQRGLPERSVSVLRAWMFQNFLHPYPKDAEKHLLAIKSGLTRSQVSNWFINARVRLWKPLIEEMYAELSPGKGRQGNKATANNDSHPRGHPNICDQRFDTN